MTELTKPRRTRLDPERRREQLLKCAVGVIAKHGLSRATQSQVAKSAGISVSAVYSYFRTREDLVRATLAEVESILMNMVTTIVANKKASHDELVELARAFTATTSVNPEFAKVWLQWSTAVDTPFWQSFMTFREKLLDLIGASLERAKRDGVAPKDLNTKAGAVLFISAGQTLAFMRFTEASELETDNFIKQVVGGALGIEPVN